MLRGRQEARMRNSDVFSPHNPSTSFPSSSVAFVVLTVVAVSSVPRTATASPVPVPTKRQPQFLDFLYPTWYTNHRDTRKGLSGESSSSTRRTKPSRSSTTPGSSRPAAVEAAPGVRGTFDTHYPQQPQTVSLSQPQPQQRPRRQQRRSISPTPQPPLAKRVTINGHPVPIKYESQNSAGGWVIADTWDLHGHHLRADTTTPNANSSSSDSLPVQNLDTTSSSSNNTLYPNISVNTTADDLDLPFGWDSGGLNPRHESYDPVIVAVFAVILVLSIVATIGLCRWRAKKLKRLRDLERLEREKEGSENTTDDGSSIGSTGEKEKRRKKSSASSSAIRKRFARFRRRHRARRNGAMEEKTSDVEEPDRNDPDPTDDDRPEESSVASIVSSTTLSRSRSSISHRSQLSTSSTVDPPPSNGNDYDLPIDVPGSATQNESSIVGTAGTEQDIGRTHERGRGRRSGRRERPRITLTGSEVTSTTMPTPILIPTPTPTAIIITLNPTIDSTPSAEPPAYPANPNPNINANTGANTNASNASTRRTRRAGAGTTGARTPLESTPASLPPPPLLLPEKAPIPGLEAEYDERDIASYSTNSANGYLGIGSPNSGLFNSRLSSSNSGLFNSRLSASSTGLAGLGARGSAPPTRRPSRVRFVDDASGGGAADTENARDETEEQVPSFEPFTATPGPSPDALWALAGASRVAGGAALRAHVATDDKGLLQRMRELRGEPSLELAGISGSEPPPPPIHLSGMNGSNDSANPTLAVDDVGLMVLAPAAPSFNEVEQWELERQMALANGSESRASLTTFITPSSSDPESSFTTAGASGSSTRRPVVSNNGFPALPAPPLLISSLGGGDAAGDVGYGLGTVWNSLNVGGPSMPPGSSTSGNGKARVPSAPPLDIPALRPSAPPPMSDEDMGASGEVIPSAPPDWEMDESIPPAIQEDHAPGAHAPEIDQNPTADLSNTDPIPDNEGEADGNGSDGDGAESIISTPPDGDEANSRWSATFRTRPEESAGLPRYEP